MSLDKKEHDELLKKPSKTLTPQADNVIGPVNQGQRELKQRELGLDSNTEAYENAILSSNSTRAADHHAERTGKKNSNNSPAAEKPKAHKPGR